MYTGSSGRLGSRRAPASTKAPAGGGQLNPDLLFEHLLITP